MRSTNCRWTPKWPFSWRPRASRPQRSGRPSAGPPAPRPHTSVERGSDSAITCRPKERDVMTDHEPFLVFASRQLYESLSDEEARELERHLAECLACRRQVAGMRGDHAGLAVLLADGPVAARVRTNVLGAAASHRRTDVRVLLA